MRGPIDSYLADIKHFLELGKYTAAKMEFEALLTYSMERNAPLIAAHQKRINSENNNI